MFRNGRRSRIARTAAAGAAALLAVGIAACSSSASTPSSSSSSASPTAPAVSGGTARVALPPGVTLSYIFPYAPPANASEYNAEGFQMLLYRPLYMFGDNGPSVDVNYPLSPANAPVYSADGKTVTITMKGWKWSNGEAVDASDVVFWLNMMEAEPAGYYGYVPGLLPDNLASYGATDENTVVLHLKSAVSRIWFTYNQLGEITPMPKAWDVTSASGAAASGGCAADTAADRWAKCKAVWTFLTAQAKHVQTYATNPLWGVVDGPWKLSSFTTAASGPVTSFVPNASYSGSPRPLLSGMTYYAYTDDSTEYTAMQAGRLDVGYIPPHDLPQLTAGQVVPSTGPLGSRYTLAPNYSFAIQYFMLNFNNPTLGPAYRQLYMRQAIQQLIDQNGMVTSVNRGYGYPTSGGVPAQPASQWVPAVQNANGGQGPYPFSVVGATSLLTSHGWKNVGGVMTCQSPGSGSNQCGAGVTAGTKLSMSMDYATGMQSFQEEVAIVKSDMSQAGIRLNLVPQSYNTIVGESAHCKPTGAGCKWDILNFGGWNFKEPASSRPVSRCSRPVPRPTRVATPTRRWTS